MLQGYITNLGKYNEGELVGKWVQFPMDDEDIELTLKEIGISNEPDENGNYYEEYFFTDWEGHNFGEYVSIDEMNEIADDLINMDDETLEAALEVWSIEEIQEAGADEIYLYTDIEDDYDLGYYYATECGMLANVPENIARYFDFEAYGRDIRIEANGAFTSNGWIECMA